AQPTPAIPMRLLVAAAAAPDTAVPCPVLQPVSVVFELPFKKFQPVSSLGFRSGWFGSAPESIMAIGMLVKPSEMLQALAAWTLAKCECNEKSGSLGVAAACATRSRSTKVNRPVRESTPDTASRA